MSPIVAAFISLHLDCTEARRLNTLIEKRRGGQNRCYSQKVKPQVSIITAVGKATPPSFLSELYQSLLEEEGVAWEWLPQWDGQEGDLPKEALQDNRVRLEENSRELGVAIARNRALQRSSAPYIRNLDSDDTLLPGSLAKQIEVFTKYREVIFVCGAEIAMNSEEVTFPSLPQGLIAPEALERYWRKEESIAIPHTSALWRRDALLAYGGWQALSGMEDVALFLTANLQEPGYSLHQPMLRRRSHAGQMTIDPQFVTERMLNKEIIHDRLLGARRHFALEILPEWKEAPRDKNRKLAVAKGESFGHSYP